MFSFGKAVKHRYPTKGIAYFMTEHFRSINENSVKIRGQKLQNNYFCSFSVKFIIFWAESSNDRAIEFCKIAGIIYEQSKTLLDKVPWGLLRNSTATIDTLKAQKQ